MGEEALWERVRDRRLGGWKFRRQHVIAGYIVDFYCAELRLAIEVDGSIHDGRGADDAQRDRVLATLDLEVLRIADKEVVDDPERAAGAIARECERRAAARGQRHRVMRAGVTSSRE